MEDLVLAAGYASAALEKLLRHGEVTYCGSPEEENAGSNHEIDCLARVRCSLAREMCFIQTS